MCSAKARAAMSGLPRSGDDKTILFGIPRMNPELAWMVAIFWIGRKPRCSPALNHLAKIVRMRMRRNPISLRKRGRAACNLTRPVRKLFRPRHAETWNEHRSDGHGVPLQALPTGGG